MPHSQPLTRDLQVIELIRRNILRSDAPLPPLAPGKAKRFCPDPALRKGVFIA
jgi:hypothetical protein